jgi:hypothetical protein
MTLAGKPPLRTFLIFDDDDAVARARERLGATALTNDHEIDLRRHGLTAADLKPFTGTVIASPTLGRDLMRFADACGLDAMLVV